MLVFGSAFAEVSVCQSEVRVRSAVEWYEVEVLWRGVAWRGVAAIVVVVVPEVLLLLLLLLLLSCRMSV